jgi:hypothetical protein
MNSATDSICPGFGRNLVVWQTIDLAVLIAEGAAIFTFIRTEVRYQLNVATNHFLESIEWWQLRYFFLDNFSIWLDGYQLWGSSPPSWCTL